MFRHGIGRQGGWVALVALIVILIIGLVMINTWFKQDPATTTPELISKLDDADHSATMGSLLGMNQQLQMLMIENPGKEFTIEELRAKLNPPPGRSGGDYVIGTDNRVYYTGYPDLAPPPNMLTKIISIQLQQ